MSACDWMDEALCAQTDPDLFHPDSTGSYDTARKLCATCPVRIQCEEHAARVEGDVSRERRHGLWAGHTPYARTKQAAADECSGYETEANHCTCPCRGCQHNCSAHHPTIKER
ncbi:WhiB family transcriptional regulator [Streptomyces chrestomyceticus]|uniref:WhiB family transcriptional regulator n=1 Tax=Streptomyces chrestomyceticus TaxID=68185 RepID=UPI0033FFE19B